MHTKISHLPGSIKGIFSYVIGLSLALFTIKITLLSVGLQILPEPGSEADIEPDIDIEAFFIATIISPIVETLLLWLTIKVLELVTDQRIKICCLSGIIWGALHGYDSILWGISAFVGFSTYSYLLKIWQRKSLLMAFIIVMSIHGLNNLYGTVLLIVLP